MTETQNVATYARIRPYNPAINEAKKLTARCDGDDKIVNQNGRHVDTYNFTRVYGPPASTEDLWETSMKPLLDFKILEGITSIFIVYGQSGSGKSFTLIGEEGHLGLFPMALQYLLHQDKVEKIELSSIECYGIKATKIGFFDLVSQLQLQQQDPKKYDAYFWKDNPRLNPKNAQKIEITMDNCLQIITDLQESSHMAPTLKNPHSSRGHTVYFAKVKLKGLEAVHFICIDLAGSEGATALGTKDEFVEGLQLAMSKGKLKLNRKQMAGLEQMYKTRSLEAGCINNGLTQLQSIFRELIKKKFAKSQGLGLRKLLSPFLTLDSAYAILFTISASANNNKVTRATLNFARQTQLVKVDTKKAKVKIDKDAVIKELNALIEQLRNDIKTKDDTIRALQPQTPKQKETETETPTEATESGEPSLLDNDSVPPMPRMLSMEDLEAQQSRESEVFQRIETLRKIHDDALVEEAKWTTPWSIASAKQTPTEIELRSYFDKFDDNKDGTIDVTELQTALKEMGQNVTVTQVQERMTAIDKDGDEKIDFEEFKVMMEQNWFIDAFQNKLSDTIWDLQEKYMNRSDALSESSNESNDDEDAKQHVDKMVQSDEMHQIEEIRTSTENQEDKDRVIEELKAKGEEKDRQIERLKANLIHYELEKMRGNAKRKGFRSIVYESVMYVKDHVICVCLDTCSIRKRLQLRGKWTKVL